MSLFIQQMNNLSLRNKMTIASAVFVVPTILLCWFLFLEKEELINFSRQEIAGVHYLRPATMALGALVKPEIAKGEVSSVIEDLKKAEEADAGGLGLTQKMQDLSVELQKVSAGASNAAAMAKTSDLIASSSDNSNITLDPDMDAYFVGDILVNQTQGILTQANNLLSAAHDLDASKDKTDDLKIAFAEARDGLATSAGNLATDLGKAIKGNPSGYVEASLAADGKALAAVVDKVAAATKTDDRRALTESSEQLIKLTSAFIAKDADVMEQLLNTRISGFYKTLWERLILGVISLVVGAIVSIMIVRSVSRPLGVIANLMSQISAGNTNVDVPEEARKDEVGGLMTAMKSFKQATVERENARKAEAEHLATEKQRAGRISSLNETFKSSVGGALDALKGAVVQLNESSTAMANDSATASSQATAIAAASEEASANVQTVAAASEELTASIQEISRNLMQSNNVTMRAAQEAKETKEKVLNLSEATKKIGDVVNLIQQIAGQTNLLALNATIEAARAGEAGKGFSVVASEVKALANQTARATEDITGHITAIQDSVKSVVEAMEHIDDTIAQVNEIAVKVSAAVEEQGSATQEISRNILEASRGTSEVTNNISRISKVIEQTGGIAKTVLTAANDLKSETGTLEEDVGSYIANIQSA